MSDKDIPVEVVSSVDYKTRLETAAEKLGIDVNDLLSALIDSRCVNGVFIEDAGKRTLNLKTQEEHMNYIVRLTMESLNSQEYKDALAKQVVPPRSMMH